MKRILVYAGLVLSIILALIQIFNWLRPLSEGHLSCAITYGVFKCPESLMAEFERTYGFLENDSLQIIALSALDSNEVKASGILARRVATAIASNLRSKIPWRLPSNLSHISGYWNVVVQNNTSRALDRVIMTLPKTTILSIKRRGENEKEQFCTEVIDLGTLQPKEEVAIFAWTWIPIAQYDFDKIKLTHAVGIGQIKIYQPVGPFGQWIDRNSFQLLFGIILLVLMAVAIYLAALAESRKESGETTQKSTQ